MTQLSETILEQYQVRKTKKQKTAFIAFMKEHIPQLQVEEGGFPKNRNLVVGDVASARLILTAHYDTCARLPFPNFITPKNILFYILYQLLIIIPFILTMPLVAGILVFLGVPATIAWEIGYLVMLGLMVYVLMLGPANKHTANDNTSGVITLCEIYASLTEAERAQVALVFFDNEENGLLGSGFFKKHHKKDSLEEKLLINFDCVSDGDNMFFVPSKAALKNYQQILEQSYRSTPEKPVFWEPKAFYPSDQANFTTTVAVAALHYKPVIGFYMDKIHTDKDRVFDKRNIQFLTQGTKQLVYALMNK